VEVITPPLPYVAYVRHIVWFLCRIAFVVMIMIPPYIDYICK
jgi:hypothetical protein